MAESLDSLAGALLLHLVHVAPWQQRGFGGDGWQSCAASPPVPTDDSHQEEGHGRYLKERRASPAGGASDRLAPRHKHDRRLRCALIPLAYRI
eukprot:5952266-Prymnesium_polylepis.1